MGSRRTYEALEERIRILEEETERLRREKQTQKDLRFRNLLLATLLETSFEGILVVDDSDHILSYNHRVIDLWNLPKSLIEDKAECPVLRFVAAQMADPKAFLARVHYLCQHREVTSRDELHLADGRVYDSYSVPMVGPDNHYYGRAWYFRDVTGEKKADAEKEKLRDQLNLAQKMESVGRLAGGVAHDFNNMLGVIIGHAELALMSLDPSHPLIVDLQEIRKAAQRSADITRQLLIFARKQTVSPRVIDLNKTVEGMLKILRRLMGEDVTLVWKPGERLFPIKIDPSQIDQILANLCVNARDAITGVGTVTIETRSL